MVSPIPLIATTVTKGSAPVLVGFLGTQFIEAGHHRQAEIITDIILEVFNCRIGSYGHEKSVEQVK